MICWLIGSKHSFLSFCIWLTNPCECFYFFYFFWNLYFWHRQKEIYWYFKYKNILTCYVTSKILKILPPNMIIYMFDIMVSYKMGQNYSPLFDLVGEHILSFSEKRRFLLPLCKILYSFIYLYIFCLKLDDWIPLSYLYLPSNLFTYCDYLNFCLLFQYLKMDSLIMHLNYIWYLKLLFSCWIHLLCDSISWLYDLLFPCTIF